MQDMLLCGKIVNTHGVCGELKAVVYCDEDVLGGLGTLYIDGRPYGLTGLRWHKGSALLTLEGVGSIDDAMALKNRELFARKSDIRLPEGHFFYADIYGFDVFDGRLGRVVGRLLEVRENPANLLFVIDRDGKEELIPGVAPFYEGVDFDKNTIMVRSIPGMLDDEN